MVDVADLKKRYKNGDRIFPNSDLSRANLSYQNLSESNFQSSDFSHANLTEATLIDCDFHDADLSFASFSNADLTGANLIGANLEGAAIATAILKDAIYDKATIFPQGINPETRGAINLDAPSPETAPIVEAKSAPTSVEQQLSSPKTNELAQKFESNSLAAPEIPKETPSSPSPPVPIEYQLTPTEARPPKSDTSAAPLQSASVPEKTSTSDQAQFPPPKTHATQTSKNFNGTTPTTRSTIQPEKKSKTGIIALSVFIILALGYCMSRAFGPIGGIGQYNRNNPFESVSFPLSECGDPRPTNSNDFPITFYPVFIKDSFDNLLTVQEKYCRDAFQSVRGNGTRAIQVASFASRNRAQDFANFMRNQLGSGDVGQPNTFYQE